MQEPLCGQQLVNMCPLLQAAYLATLPEVRGADPRELQVRQKRVSCVFVAH
jgi:hypothetical protein